MTLTERVRAFLRPQEAKAASGIGMSMMTYGVPLSSLTRDPRRMMREAQSLGVSNLYIRAAERTIGQRFSTVPWHLEDASGEELADDAITQLIERPYRPLPGDPVTATPRTRSDLWRITCRHMGLCGISFWYLDQTDALSGFPLQTLYINPARMTPAEDRQGNLLGWVLDADLPGSGVPLPLSSVLAFRLEPADAGHYGLGLVESAYSRADLMRLADHHARKVLQSGGRLAGIFSPPTGESIPEDQYQQLVRDIRAITELDDAAMRSLVLRGPIEFERTTAPPSELDLEAMAMLGRDGILDLWGVPLSQLSGQGPGGMNSGETRKYDEASLWQNAIGPRLRAFSETLQFDLLDRLPTPPQLVIEEPEFDDEAPAYALAQQAAQLPLTNEERRAIIGMEPTGDDAFDKAVWLPISLVEAWTVGRGEPPPLPPVTEPIEELPEEAKARAVPGVDRVRQRMTRHIATGMDDVLRRMAADIAAKVRRNAAHLATHPNDDAMWWDPKWEEELLAVIRPAAALAAEATHDRTRAMLSTAGKADLRDMVMARLTGALGERIRGITRTTRDKVRQTIADGIADGLGAAELGAKVASAAAFDEYRAEVVARTETNRILNLSQLYTFEEFGVGQVRAIDGDDDPECAARDGQTFTTEEAAAILDHPNGTLDWVPLAFAA